MATITAAAGGGNWNATATWTGGVVPTSSDDVVLASTSGNVALTASTACRSLNCTGYTGTLTHNASVTLSIGDATAGTGNNALVFVAGMTYTISGGTSFLTFVSTSTTQQTVNTAGKTVGTTTFNGAGGSWILGANFVTTQDSSNSIILTAGALATGNFSITTGSFTASSSSARTLSLGSSTISLASNGGGGLNVNATNLSFSAGTSAITISNSNNTTNFGAGLSYYNVTINYGNGSGPIQGVGTTFNNLTLLGGNQARLRIANNFTINGLLTINSAANNSANVPLCISDVAGTVYTLSVTQAPTLSYTTFQDIAISGTGAPFSGTMLGDAGGNSGITFPAGRTLYWVGNSGTFMNSAKWATTSGGAGGQDPPRPQDTVIFDANSVTTTGVTLTFNAGGYPSLDLSNVLNSPALSFQNTNGFLYYFGNITLKAGMTISASGSGFLLRGKAAVQTIDAKGIAFTGTLYLDKAGGTVRLLSDFVTTNALNFSSTTNSTDLGTFDANGFNVTATQWASTPANQTRTVLMGSGTWTLTGTGSVLDLRNASVNSIMPGTSTLTFSDVSATAKSISFDSSAAGWDLYNIVFPAGGAGAVYNWNGIMRINNNMTVGGPNTLNLVSATTKTVYGITTIGASGQVVALQSNNSGQKAYMVMNGNSGKQVIDSGTTRTADVQYTFMVTNPVTGQSLASNGSNLVTNPSFEAGLGSWGNGSNVTMTIDTTTAYIGAQSLKMANASGPGGNNYVAQGNIPVTAGTPYTASAWIKQTLTSGNTSLILKYYNAGGSLTGSQSVNITGSVANWTRYAITLMAPLTTTNAQIVYAGDSAPSPYSGNIDAVQIEPGYNATPYSDGVLVGQTNIRRTLGKTATAVSFALPTPGLILSSGTYVNAGSAINLTGQSFSIAITAKRRGNFGTQTMMIGQGTASNNMDLQLGFGSGNDVKFDTFASNIGGSVISDTALHHYLFVYDKTAGSRQIYVDGVQVANGTGFVDFQGTGNFIIGGRGSNPTNNPFDGFISNVRVWSGVALSSAQALAYYNDGTQPAGSIASYRFREGSGTTVADSVGTNNGTIVNSGYAWSNAMFIKTITKLIAYAAVATVSSLKNITKKIAYATSAVVSLANQKLYKRTMTYAATGVTSLVRTIAKTLSYSANAVESMSTMSKRSITLAYSATGLPTVTAFTKRYIILAVAGVASVTLNSRGYHYVTMVVNAVAKVKFINSFIAAFKRTVLGQNKDEVTILRQGE